VRGEPGSASLPVTLDLGPTTESSDEGMSYLLLDRAPGRVGARRTTLRAAKGGRARPPVVDCLLAAYNLPVNEALLALAKGLPAPERLEFIAALWDTLDSDEIPVTHEERQVLQARMADIEANPSAEESWSEAKVWLESRRC